MKNQKSRIGTNLLKRSRQCSATRQRQKMPNEKQNTADFMIEFKTLTMKVNIDKLHAIFLLKKNV